MGSKAKAKKKAAKAPKRDPNASYVLLNAPADGAPASAVPPQIVDPDLRFARRSCHIRAMGENFGLALAIAGYLPPAVTVQGELIESPPSLLPALVEAFAQLDNESLWEQDCRRYAVPRITYGVLLGLWEAGDFREKTPHPFTVVRETLEAEGAAEPPDDLPSENHVELEVELYRLTGYCVVNLTDDEVWALYLRVINGETVSEADFVAKCERGNKRTQP